MIVCALHPDRSAEWMCEWSDIGSVLKAGYAFWCQECKDSSKEDLVVKWTFLPAWEMR